MKIFTKLILALLLTSLMILTIIFTVVQLSFDRGMLEYVNQKQLENLQQFSDNLSQYYQKKGSWQHLLQRHAYDDRLKVHSDVIC